MIKNRKKKKVLVHWLCEGTTTTKKNLSSIKWRSGLLMQSSKMPWMSPRNVCVHWLHNITSQEWSVIGLVCVHILVYVTEGMPHLSSACAGFPGCPGDVWDPSCLWVNNQQKKRQQVNRKWLGFPSVLSCFILMSIMKLRRKWETDISGNGTNDGSSQTIRPTYESCGRLLAFMSHGTFLNFYPSIYLCQQYQDVGWTCLGSF